MVYVAINLKPRAMYNIYDWDLQLYTLRQAYLDRHYLWARLVICNPADIGLWFDLRMQEHFVLFKSDILKMLTPNI